MAKTPIISQWRRDAGLTAVAGQASRTLNIKNDLACPLLQKAGTNAH